jgi:hypothetical protein
MERLKITIDQSSEQTLDRLPVQPLAHAKPFLLNELSRSTTTAV